LGFVFLVRVRLHLMLASEKAEN